VLGSVRVKALPDRNGISELCQLSGNHGLPYGLHDSLCTLRHACSMRVLKVTGVVCVRVSPSVPQRPAYLFLRMSAHDATLATGGWLVLPRQGLSPCKAHHASLGALTPAITWLWPAPHDGQPSLTNHQTVMREEYVEIGDSGPKCRVGCQRVPCQASTFPTSPLRTLRPTFTE